MLLTQTFVDNNFHSEEYQGSICRKDMFEEDFDKQTRKKIILLFKYSNGFNLDQNDFKENLLFPGH